MRGISVLIPVAAAATLAGCATEPYDTPTPVASVTPTTGAIVTVPAATVTPPAAPPAVISAAPAAPVVAFHAGSGVIESVAMTRLVSPASASTGSSVASVNAYRLTVRMDDGTVQTLDQDNRAFMVGDRIRITTDGHVIR